MIILTPRPLASSKTAQKLLKLTVKNNTVTPLSPQKITFSDANQRLDGIVPAQKMADSGRLVVRGNPRNAREQRDVEFPLAVENDLKPYSVRARAKKTYTKHEQLEYRHEKRSTLYAGMVTAGKVLPNYVDKKGRERQHSVCLCRRYMKTHENAKNHVTLSVDGNHTAKFSGLIVCDNNWVCPVCSSIHLDTRAKEITQVQKNFLAAGRDKHWSTWMLTLTIPHTRADMLEDLTNKKSEVMSDFHAHSAIKKLKARIGWKGYVDSLEVRHSIRNGWHPHHHILGFFTNMHPNTRVQCVYDAKRDYYRIATQSDKKQINKSNQKLDLSYKKFLKKATFRVAGSGDRLSLDFVALRYAKNLELHKIEVQKYVYHVFAYLCERHGLSRPSEKYGVDFRESDDIQDYLTKQTKIAHELTAEHSKKSSYSRSQWEILRDCESDNPQMAAYSESLFREFAEATKGKPKIHWSPGFLRLWLDDEEEENEALLHDEETDNDAKSYVIKSDIWHRFFSNADRKYQRQLLEIAETDSFNSTQNTELILLAARILLNIEQEKSEQSFSDEQERLFQEWLKIPPSPSPDFSADLCHSAVV